jgi:hypothetical protein
MRENSSGAKDEREEIDGEKLSSQSSSPEPGATSSGSFI